MNYWKFLYKVFGGKYTDIVDPPILDEVVAKTNDCKLKTCLKDYGGGDNKFRCEIQGHIYCYCDHCAEHPTCLRCRLFMQTGQYL